uniref:B cell specific activator protein variant B delta 2/3 n=1 Tax=Homo sapiens TaxID=9606 RepID=C0KTF3_HUMAN|nr:B cell specific activator protein variant B delta 2/3 [Homo sapiens]
MEIHCKHDPFASMHRSSGQKYSSHPTNQSQLPVTA